MLDNFANTALGEFVIFASVFGVLFLVGILPAIIKVQDRRKVSAWAIKSVEHSNAVGTPIDRLQPQMQPQQTNVVSLFEHTDELNGFSHSNIDLPELDENVQVLVNTINQFNEENLAKTKEQIEFLVGEKSAELITSGLQNVVQGEQVICGSFLADSISVELNGVILALSTDEPIQIDDGDYVLVKGHILPNGTFRVLHWDDPENIEAGYGIEEFVIAA